VHTRKINDNLPLQHVKRVTEKKDQVDHETFPVMGDQEPAGSYISHWAVSPIPFVSILTMDYDESTRKGLNKERNGE